MERNEVALNLINNCIEPHFPEVFSDVDDLRGDVEIEDKDKKLAVKLTLTVSSTTDGVYEMDCQMAYTKQKKVSDGTDVVVFDEKQMDLFEEK